MGASRGLPIVRVQHSAEFFMALDASHLGQGRRWLDKFVVDPLMITAMAIMTDENGDGDGFAEMFSLKKTSLSAGSQNQPGSGS